MLAQTKIAVLGAGSWGTALGLALARNHHDVTLWPRSSEHGSAMQLSRCNEKYLDGFIFPDSLEINTDLESIATEHSVFLIAVPSHAFKGVLLNLKEAGVAYGASVLWATKGFDAGVSNQNNNGGPVPRLLNAVVDQTLGHDGYHAIISGPSFSKEVAACLPTAIAASGNTLEAAKFAASLFHSDTMRVYTNDDLIGVQLGGAVKNVIAIAAGISDGLGYGANARSAIITRGLAEIARLGQVMGARKDTFLGLAGMGDLVLTCTDDQSRNRRLGLALGKNALSNITSKSGQVVGNNVQDLVQASLEKIGQEVEGYNSSREVFKLALHHNVEMPIVEQVYKVLFKGLSARDAVAALLNRELNNE